MSVQPNKKAEELLRAYACQRRGEAAAAGEMPVVTRNLLQAEVRKQFPMEQGRGMVAWASLRGLWLRLALGSSVLALIALGLFLSFSTPPKSERDELVVAANRSTPAENISRLDQSREPQQIIQPAVISLDPPQASASVAKSLFDAPAPGPQLSTMDINAVALSKSSRAESLDASQARNFKAASLSTNAFGLSSARAKVSAQNGVQGGQRYVFTDRLLKLGRKTELTENVGKDSAIAERIEERSRNFLMNFVFETAGDQVRIVDSDGSVYAGKLNDIDSTHENESQKKSKSEEGLAGINGKRFSARGRNLKLQKEMTLAGTLRLAAAQKPVSPSTTIELKLVQQRLELEGIARIGTNETRIDAFSELAP